MEQALIDVISRGALTIVCVALLVGCATTTEQSTTIDEPTPLDAGPEVAAVDHARAEIIGQSVEGRLIEAILLGGGSVSRTILFVATIHGNESAGTPLMQRLIEDLHDDHALLASSRIVIVPVANPDGFAKRRRTNARGVDLNRNFAATNHRTTHRGGSSELSEPEAEALAGLIERERPRAIISLHQPLACIDYDGPGEELAELIAESTGLPVRKLGARPGSLGSFAGVDLGIPIITLELPGAASRWDADELWDRYGQALLVAIRHVNNLDPIRAGAIGPAGR